MPRWINQNRKLVSVLVFVVGAASPYPGCFALADEPTLSDVLAAAKEDFRPLTSERLSQAKDDVQNAMKRTNEFLSANPVRAAGWKKYLLWDAMTDDLSRETVDLHLWRRVLQRVSANANGLELPIFQELRAAVHALVAISAARKVPDPEAAYQRLLKEISEVLPNPDKPPPAEQLRQLSQITAELVRLQQAPELVRRLSERFAAPNLRLFVPESMVRRIFEEEIDWPYDYGRYIGGAAVRGDGRLVGTLRSSLQESDSNAAIRLEVEGTSDSYTWSSESGVGVGTTNSLEFESVSVAQFSPQGIQLEPFQSSGTLSSRITRMSNSYGGRAASVARSRAYSQHRARLGISERTALTDVSRGLTREIGTKLSDLDARYQNQIRLPLLRCDRFPENIQLCSGRNGVEMRAVVAQPYQLAAAENAPELTTADQLHLLCHESSVENLLPARMNGRELSLQEILAGVLPGSALTGEDNGSLRLTLDHEEPAEIEFSLGSIFVNFHASHLAYEYDGGSGEAEGDIDIEFRYRLQGEDAGWSLALAGTPTVHLPPMGLRGVTLRRVLANILERDTPDTIPVGEIEPPQGLKNLGPLKIANVSAEDGWLDLRLESAER